MAGTLKPALQPVIGLFAMASSSTLATILILSSILFFHPISSQAQQFSIATSTNGPGQIVLDPTGGTYENGTRLIVTAVPDSGYRFVDWDGALDGRDHNPDTLIVDGDKSITAVFRELPKYEVTLNIVGAGDVTLSPSGGVYYEGTDVVLSATPAAGFVHAGWDGDGSGYANPDTLRVDSNLTVTAIFNQAPSARFSEGIFVGTAELQSLPVTGISWETLQNQADLPAGPPNLADQVDSVNVRVLAKALVYARTGASKYRTEVVEACMAAIGTEEGQDVEALALGRELAAYVIAADLVALPPTEDAVFRDWLQTLLNKDLSGRTLVSTHEDRPNNWGTQCGASRAAVAAYLGDARELARTALVFQGYLGDRSAYSDFSFGELDWQADPQNPVGINTAGATINGQNVDGVLPDDQRRAGGFVWPPPRENYVYEGLQGALMQAVILWRAGYDVWNWSDKALLRAFNWLYEVADYPPDDDDVWLPYIVNHFYQEDFISIKPSRPGKNAGWTDWIYGGPYDVTVGANDDGDILLTTLGFDAANTARVGIFAAADSAYVFDGWGGDLTGMTNPDTLRLDNNKVVSAQFVRKYKLAVQTVGNGRVELTPVSPDSGYKDHEIVALSAVPDSGYVFTEWSGDVFGSNNPISTLMDRDKSAAATFVRIDGDGSQTFTFRPTDDAQVKSSRPTKNYGDDSSMKVDAEDIFNSYLKFDVTSVHGDIESVKLKLFVVNDSDDGGSFFLVSNNYADGSAAWNEDLLTWDNAPPMSGTAISSLGRVNQFTVVEADLTHYIRGNGVYSFGLTNSSGDKAEYSTKEGTRPPELVIVTQTSAENQPPIARNDSTITTKNTPVIIEVLANDHDDDGSLDITSLTIVSQPAHGSAQADVTTGIITYTPGPEFSGVDSFDYTISDDDGAPALPATVTVSVSQVNEKPVTNHDAASGNEDEALVIPVLANDHDSDGDLDSASVAITLAPVHGLVEINAANGDLTYVPDMNYFGEDTLTYTVADDAGLVSEPTLVTVTIQPVNDAPVAVPDTAITSEDTPLLIDVTSNDADIDGNLDATSLSVVKQPAHGLVVLDESSRFVYTPAFNFVGVDSFLYKIADDEGLASNQAYVYIEVLQDTDAPVAIDDTVATAEDTPLLVAVLSNDFDPDGSLDPRTVAIVTTPGHGAAEIDSLTGEITYTPLADFFGADTFSYKVADNVGVHSNAALVWLTVTAVNDAPVARDDSAATEQELPVEIAVTLNDSDIDSDLNSAALAILRQPDNGSVVINHAVSTLTYTPAPAFTGMDSFSYAISDAEGAASNTATVFVAVSGVDASQTFTFLPTDDAQVKLTELDKNYGDKSSAKIERDKFISFFKFSVNGLAGSVHKATLRFRTGAGSSDGSDNGGALFLTANDFQGTTTPWNEQLLTARNAPATTGLALGTQEAVAPDQAVVFDVTAAINGDGVYSFCIISNSDNMARYQTRESSSPPELIVETGGGMSNRPPVALNDTTATQQGTAVTLEVLANDTDSDGALVANSLVVVQMPQSGALQPGTLAGQLIYTPSVDFVGIDSLKYTIQDDDGAVSNAATVVITVHGNTTPSAPLAVNDTVSTVVDVPLQIDVLANDFDIDGDLDAASLTVVSQALNGNAEVQAGKVAYTPNPAFFGTDIFDYTVSDHSGLVSNRARVFVSVEKASETATLSFESTDDGQVKITDIDKNYGDKSSAKIDVEKFKSYYKFNVAGLSGTVSKATVRLVVGDGSSDGGDSGGEIYMTANSFLDVAEPWTEELLTARNAPATISTMLSSSGPVNPSQTVNFDVTQAVTGDGIYSFLLSSTSGDQVRYVTKEGALPPLLIIETGNSVGSTNLPPVAKDDSVLTTENTVLTIDVRDNDADPDGSIEAAVVTITELPLNGTVDIETVSGNLIYTPNSGFIGEDTFRYALQDELGATSNTAVVVAQAIAAGDELVLTFAPSDDGQVKLSRPENNYGDSNTTKVERDSYLTYLKFSVNGVTGTILRAYLKLHTGAGEYDGSDDGGAIFLTANTLPDNITPWTEENLTAAVAPEILSSAISSAGAVNPDESVEFDLTPAIAGDGVYSFCIRSESGNLVRYQTRENVIAPELVVEVQPTTGADGLVESVQLLTAHEQAQLLPAEFGLRPAYPNPFNPETTLEYTLPYASQVELNVYNVRGQMVRTLVNRWQEAGFKRVQWFGRNEYGRLVGSGIYFVQLRVAGKHFHRRLILQK